MYVNVTEAGIHLAETDVFTAFEVRTSLTKVELENALAVTQKPGGDGSANITGSWGYLKDGHMWVSRERIIAEAEPLHTHIVRWREQFDGLMAYAKSQGWLDETGRFVRAHVEYL